MTPAPPGAGSVSLTLATPAFFLLVATLGLFVAMLFVLHSHYPNRKRGFEGYFDAAGVSLGFLVFGVVLVVVLVVRDPQANATSWALYQTILTGYWLAFAIPVVTVGSSVQARSRGAIRWMVPSIVVAALMFLGIFAYYYSAAG
jgi:cell division protein FtsW (lipid II flippase)